MARDYTLYLTKHPPEEGAKGFPGKWTKDPDHSEQIPDLHFQSEQPKPNQSKDIMNIAPVKFTTLAELVSGSPIGCIQGKITDLFKPNTGTGQYGDWIIQNGTISDGTLKHGIAFMDAEHILPMNLKGKTIRVTAQDYKDKLKGIELKEKEVKGKPNRTVNVKFPAKIEIQEGSSWVEHVPSGEGSSSPSQSTEASQPATQTKQANYSQPMDDESISNDPAENRITDYFNVFNLVCIAASKDPDEIISGLSSSDIKEITTGICMSFKGKYGVHRAPIFGSNRTSPGKSKAGATASQTETTTGEEDAPESWRDAVHKDIKLGDYEEDKLAELIQWAIDTENPKSPSGKVLRPFLMEANAEKKKNASKAISKKLAAAGMGTSFDEGEVDEVCTEEFGGDFASLEYPSLFTLGNQLTGYVAAMKAAWTAKQPKASGPKKIAKKAMSVEDEEEDSMPS